jgi:hypothetical protein
MVPLDWGTIVLCSQDLPVSSVPWGSGYPNKYVLIFLNRPKKILGEIEIRT